MTNQISCIVVNDLPEIKFIAGTKQVLEFDFIDQDGAELDISSSLVSWAMSPYGQSNYVSLLLSASISASPINRATVTISGSSTSGLYGKFIHQPIIVDYQGESYRPSQGVITIIPAIT